VTVAASTNTANPITQAFQQLSQDLKAGNLSAAQSDYSTLQQDFQSRATQVSGGHHHHLRDGGSGPSQSNPISTLFSQLGTALQAGNLTAAQTAYSTLQSDFEQFAQSNGFSTGLAAGTGTGLGSSGFSINA
jgi:outer membrane protein assembly factor BamD (BamD/ComL family)